MEPYEKTTLNDRQNAAFRRTLGQYGGSPLPAKGREKELTDAVMADELGKIAPECKTTIDKVVAHQIPAFVIRNLPLGNVPLSASYVRNEIEDEDKEEYAQNKGVYFSDHVVAALAGSTGRKTKGVNLIRRNKKDLENHMLSYPERKHIDREYYTILLCIRGGYISSAQEDKVQHTLAMAQKQVAERNRYNMGFDKEKEPQHKPITNFYLLKDVLALPEMQSHLEALKDPNNFTEEGKIGPILLDHPSGKGYVLNKEIFGYPRESPSPINEKAKDALHTLRSAIMAMKPSFSVPLERGDAIIFDQQQVIVHDRAAYLAHEKDDECRRLQLRLCSNEPIEPIAPAALAAHREKLLSVARLVKTTGATDSVSK